jgi:CBS-domain-containing membrane protein
LLVAVFVWIGAEHEAGTAHMKSALGGIPVRNAMVTDFRTLSPHDSLDHVIELILTGSQHDFPVVEDGKIVGILMRSDLLAALARQQPALVAEVMQSDFQTAEPGEMMQTAFQRLQECACPTLPILDRGRLVGMLSADHVGEFLIIQAARGNGALRLS